MFYPVLRGAARDIGRFRHHDSVNSEGCKAWQATHLLGGGRRE